MTRLVAQRVSADVAEEVRVAMTRRRISQARLASALGLSQAAVNRRLSGAVDFTISELRAVADALEVDITDLIAPTARSGS